MRSDCPRITSHLAIITPGEVKKRRIQTSCCKSKSVFVSKYRAFKSSRRVRIPILINNTRAISLDTRPIYRSTLSRHIDRHTGDISRLSTDMYVGRYLKADTIGRVSVGYRPTAFSVLWLLDLQNVENDLLSRSVNRVFRYLPISN